jgi:hypothetical protein
MLIIPYSGPSLGVAFDIDAINSDGFRIRVDVTGSSEAAAFHGFLAFGSSPVVPGGHGLTLTGVG